MTDRPLRQRWQRGSQGRTDLTAALARLPEPTLNAIWLGALLTMRVSDGDLADEAAELAAALEHLRAETIEGAVTAYTPKPARGGAAKALTPMLDVGALRHALENELKLAIGYIDAKARETRRTVWPLAVENYGPNGAMLGWCEYRQGFRNFRFDRVTALAIVNERLDAPRAVMVALHDARLASRGD